MREESLKNRIANFLLRKEEWVASGFLQELAQQNGYTSPQNTGRRCRELVEEGILEVEYRKNHAWYRHLQGRVPIPKVEAPKPMFREIIREDGQVVMIMA